MNSILENQLVLRITKAFLFCSKSSLIPIVFLFINVDSPILGNLTENKSKTTFYTYVFDLKINTSASLCVVLNVLCMGSRYILHLSGDL